MLKPQCDAGAPHYNPFPRYVTHMLAVSTAGYPDYKKRQLKDCNISNFVVLYFAIKTRTCLIRYSAGWNDNDSKTQIHSLIKQSFHVMHTYHLWQYAMFTARIESARQFSSKL